MDLLLAVIENTYSPVKITLIGLDDEEYTVTITRDKKSLYRVERYDMNKKDRSLYYFPELHCYFVYYYNGFKIGTITINQKIIRFPQDSIVKALERPSISTIKHLIETAMKPVGSSGNVVLTLFFDQQPTVKIERYSDTKFKLVSPGISEILKRSMSTYSKEEVLTFFKYEDLEAITTIMDQKGDILFRASISEDLTQIDDHFL